MGARYSRERRRKISEGVNERYRRLVEEASALPDHKRCPQCKKTRPREDFGVTKRKLKCGLTSETLASWCKECCRLREKERRKRLEEEGIDVKARKAASDRRWRASLSPSKRRKLRERMREAQTAQRRKKGMRAYKPHKPLRSYDREVAARPISRWLQEEGAVDLKGIDAGPSDPRGILLLAQRTGVSERRLGSLIREEQAAVRLSTVDKILTGLDMPHVLNELYPQEN